MSEDEAQNSTGRPPPEDHAAEVEGAAASHAQPEAAEASGNRSGRRPSSALAWMALLVALAALGAATQQYWRQWIPGEPPWSVVKGRPASHEFQSLTERVGNVAERVGNTAEDAAQNTQAIEQLRRAVTTLENDLEAAPDTRPEQGFSERADRLAARLDRLEGQYNTRLGSVRTRIENLEDQVGRRLERFELRLADLGGGRDRAEQDLAARLRLVEIDSLFALAQDQLAISGNTAAARRAWRRGLERLAGLSDDRFSDLKTIARREFERLEGYRPPDTAARIERVYTIVDQIDEWPAAYARVGGSSQAGGSSQGAGSGRAQPGEKSEATPEGWRERLGSVLDGLVTIESVDRAHVSPAEVDLARERLQTILQAAALALVRGRVDTAQSLIKGVLARADRHFDTNAAVVEESLQWLSGVGARDDPDVRPPSLEDSRAEIARLLGRVR